MNDHTFTPARAILARVETACRQVPNAKIGGIPRRDVARAIRDVLRFLSEENEEAWTPFLPAVVRDFSDDAAYVESFAKATGQPSDVIREQLRIAATCDYYRNNLYQVAVRRLPGIDGAPDILHLSIKRLDQRPIRDWRHFQRIKNELVGPEHEGIELYPAESRLADSANQYHLWVVDDPAFRFPVGFDDRYVKDGEHDGTAAVQRKMKAAT